MSKTNVYLLIVGMAAVTYIPRALPAFFTDRLKVGGRLEKFLSLLPYAAMSALIFPGVFSVDAEHPLFGVAGALAASLLALKRCPLIVCVLAAVAVNYALYALI